MGGVHGLVGGVSPVTARTFRGRNRGRRSRRDGRRGSWL